MILWIFLPVLVVLAMSAGIQAQELREVPASEILEKIQAGEDVNYTNVRVTGELDVRRIDLETVPIARTQFEIKVGLKEELKIVESEIIIINSVFENDVYFSNTQFRKTLNFQNTSFFGSYFNGAHFNSYAKFRGANFNNQAYFLSASFNDRVSFTGANFSAFAIFMNATFSDNIDSACVDVALDEMELDACFWYANFNDALFENAKFYGTVSFCGANFNEKAVFRHVSFDRFVSFQDVDFNGGAVFKNATFSVRTSFWSAVFNGDADFENADFGNYADFKNASFGKYANFRDADFGGDTGFEFASFSDDTNFEDTDFGGYANFEVTSFSGRAYFTYANFSDDADFKSASFSEGANFWYATFGDDAYFWHVHFSGNTYFDSANFSGNAEFTSAEFDEVDFSNTAFSRMFLLHDADFKRIKVSWGSLKELHSFDGLTYIKLIKNFREMEQFKDADDAYYQYRRQSQENKKWSLSKLSDRFMQLSCGYGVKPWRTAAWAVAIVLIFTPFYFWRGGIKRLKENNEDEKQDVSLYDAFYFSMTTFTTLGYGDLYPADRYRMVAVTIEGLVGWLILALFLVTLANVMIRP